MHDLVQVLKALADPTRVRLLALIHQSPLCVCEAVDVLGMTQSRISRHLGILRTAGLARDERRGQWVFYAPNPDCRPECQSLVESALAWYGETDAGRRDVSRVLERIAARDKNGCPPYIVEEVNHEFSPSKD